MNVEMLSSAKLREFSRPVFTPANLAHSTSESKGRLSARDLSGTVLLTKDRFDSVVTRMASFERRSNQAASNVYLAADLLPVSSTQRVGEDRVATITNNPTLNSSQCCALNMLKLYSALAESMKDSADWQSQMLTIMDNLNSCILQMSKDLQTIMTEMSAQQQRELESATRKGGVCGLLLNLLFLVVGVVISVLTVSPVGIAMGVTLALNSTAQAVGNLGKIIDPESATKNDCWQNSLTKNGMFAIFDLAGDGGGQTAQMVANIFMLVLSEGTSAASLVANKAVLTLTQVTAKLLAMADNLLKVVGMLGSVITQNKASASNATTQSSIWSSLSMGALAAVSNKIIHATGLDQKVGGSIFEGIFDVVLSAGTQLGLHKIGSSQLEDLQSSTLIQAVRNIERGYNLQNQAKNLCASEVRAELAAKDYHTQNFSADSKNLEKSYDVNQTQSNLLMQSYSSQNDTLVQGQQALVELIKQVEQIFAQIFRPQFSSSH